MYNLENCPVCGQNQLEIFDYIDFNKYCTLNPESIISSGFKICYTLCNHCNFLFAPDLCRWDIAKFKKFIYNDDYITYDEDYAEKRPKENFEFLINTIKDDLGKIRHLDYGGGNGKLSELLNSYGINSENYEPFSSSTTLPLGKFNLITAFEVMEHVPDQNVMLTNIYNLLADGGSFLFSTLLNDGQIKKGGRLDWWYAAPRNGHICLHSSGSLNLLARKYRFNYQQLNLGLHVFKK